MPDSVGFARCPQCGGRIVQGALACPRCGTSFRPQPRPTLPEPTQPIYPPGQQPAVQIVPKDRTTRVVGACSCLFVLACVVFVLAGIFSASGRGDDRREAWHYATVYVRNSLKSPSSADFCSSSEASVAPVGLGQYRVRGWVDAQNSFGAKLRSDFSCVVYKDASGEWHGEDLMITGR